MTDSAARTVEAWSGEKLRVPIPLGRDPFINTPLAALGPGADGVERFWITTWNANVGCLAALVTEAGAARIHRFNDTRHPGFYSAVPEDEDTLWLCGDLSRVVRFSLRTGELEEYATGAPSALVFQGMRLDRETGKLFAVAFPRPEVAAFSFDTRRCAPVKVYEDFASERYMHNSFPNGDGSHTFVLSVPGETLLHWDPRSESLEAKRISEHIDTHSRTGGTNYRLIADDKGRWYFPRRGWYDPQKRAFLGDGPRPEREMTWFHRQGELAWGVDWEDGDLKIGLWNMGSGGVRSLGAIPDCPLHNINVSTGGKIIAVNMYGYFYRLDGHTGALEMTRRLETDAIGHVDCLCRIDHERLLGTPFITQRFWQVNTRTGAGCDCGRAAPGGGEVLKTWKIGDKAYMAAYAGGQLVEYDPARPSGFPENPRVVAAPPHAMRPVGAADDGRHIYYTCSMPYGNLGSMLTKYDTATGLARYVVNPLPEQMILSMFYDQPTDSLLCGTTMHADCMSCPPSSSECYFARIDAQTLAVVAKAAAPAGATRAVVEGPLGAGRYLCRCLDELGKHETVWFVLDSAALAIPPRAAMHPLPGTTELLLYAGKPGYFLVQRGSRLEVWDMRAVVPVRVLVERFEGYTVKVQDNTVYIVHTREIEILEGCLDGLP